MEKKVRAVKLVGKNVLVIFKDELSSAMGKVIGYDEPFFILKTNEGELHIPLGKIVKIKVK